MELELNVQKREVLGKKVKILREKGFIPAVVYGAGHKPISIQVDAKEFEKVFQEAGESTIIKLKVQSSKSKVDETKNVLIHDIAKDPVLDNIIHIDFYQVQMDKPISAKVSLIFEGEAPAVKNLEGILIKNIIEVEVEALPKDLPHEIKVDISSLETFDDIIRIKDLNLPSGVKVLEELEEVIVLVEPPRAKEELAKLEEEPEKKVEEVEVVGEKSVERPEGIQAPKSEGFGKEGKKKE